MDAVGAAEPISVATMMAIVRSIGNPTIIAYLEAFLEKDLVCGYGKYGRYGGYGVWYYPLTYLTHITHTTFLTSFL
jgi:hypothetical protein